MCALFGIAGLVLSLLALRRIERAGGGVAGRTTALVGIATSTVSIWAWELAVVLWLHYGAGITLPLVNWMLPRF